MAKKYNVNDGRLLLTLEEAEEGGYIVTSPLDPELVTEAETISEAFMMARDALKGLAESRAGIPPEAFEYRLGNRVALCCWKTPSE